MKVNPGHVKNFAKALDLALKGSPLTREQAIELGTKGVPGNLPLSTVEKLIDAFIAKKLVKVKGGKLHLNTYG
jgi:hypothetical protein